MEVLRGVEDGSEERVDPESVVLSDEQQAAHDASYAQITEKNRQSFCFTELPEAERPQFLKS